MKPLNVGLVAWALLVLLQPVWYLGLAPPSNGNVVFALLLTLPALLLPLLALRRGARRALLWVGIACLFYFCHGVVCAWVYANARVPAIAEALLCVVVIGALGVDARRGRAGSR